MSPAPAAGRPRRPPNESMSLLSQFMESSIEEGYADAARARENERPAVGPRQLTRRAVVVACLALLGVLTAVSYNRVEANRPTAERERAALIARIESGSAETDQLQGQLEVLRRQVTQLEAERLAAAAGPDHQLYQALRVITGDVAVRGPGIQVVVDDAKSMAAGSDAAEQENKADPGRVRDSDLQMIVNGLWRAGAEAVAVNGQRLTSLSAIRSAGDAILVDYRPLSPPYTLQAIGDPTQLENNFRRSTGGRYLHNLRQEFDIRYEVSDLDEMRLAAASRTTLTKAKAKGNA